MAPIGAMIGTFTAPKLMAKLGRHRAIVVTEIILIFAGLLTLPLNIPCMMAGRFV